MWKSIEGAYFGGAMGQTHVTERPRGLQHSAVRWMGIAATLVVGIGIGRMSLRLDHATQTKPPVTSVAQVEQAPKPDTAMARPYELETSQYLGQTAALLVSLPTEAKTPDAQFAARAADLLTRTRLLMDSPAASNPSMRSLLDDLELVLMQVVRLQGSSNRTDLELINRALEQRDVIPRLRTAAADISAN
jgi:uncharacterized membrane-anchored protein YhcB (DUF1043 family)